MHEIYFEGWRIVINPPLWLFRDAINVWYRDVLRFASAMTLQGPSERFKPLRQLHNGTKGASYRQLRRKGSDLLVWPARWVSGR